MPHTPSLPAAPGAEPGDTALWQQLVEARRVVGLTQAQLAERLGVSRSQVAKIEQCGYGAYTLTTLHRYVQALGPEFHLAVRLAQCPGPASAS